MIISHFDLNDKKFENEIAIIPLIINNAVQVWGLCSEEVQNC